MSDTSCVTTKFARAAVDKRKNVTLFVHDKRDFCIAEWHVETNAQLAERGWSVVFIDAEPAEFLLLDQKKQVKAHAVGAPWWLYESAVVKKLLE